MSSLQVDNIQTYNSNPPVIKNVSGTEVGTFCRAWVNFNGTSTVAIRASFNVSSITDNGTGDYTVTFTTALADANYSVVLGVNQITSNNRNTGIAVQNTDASSLTTTTVRVQTGTPSNGAAADVGVACVSIFR